MEFIRMKNKNPEQRGQNIDSFRGIVRNFYSPFRDCGCYRLNVISELHEETRRIMI